MKLRTLAWLGALTLLCLTGCSIPLVPSGGEGAAVAAQRALAPALTLQGAKGSVVVSAMQNQSLTVTYQSASPATFARLYMTEGNGMGLVLAAKDMTWANGAYSLTWSHPSFTSGARIYLGLLEYRNGTETTIPQGSLGTTSSWTSFTYGSLDPVDPVDPVDPTDPAQPAVLELTGPRGSVSVSAMKAGSFTLSLKAASAASFARLFVSEGNGTGLILASKDAVWKDGAYTWTVEHPSLGLGAKVYAAVLEYRNGVETLIPQGSLATVDTWARFTMADQGQVDPTDPTDPTDPVDPTDPTDPVDPVDPVDPGQGTAGLYLDRTLTAASWLQLSGGTRAHFAIGDWDGTTVVSLADGVASMVVSDAAPGKYFSGGTLGQVPLQADGTSYYDFSQVATLRFSIRSASLQASQIKFILQDVDSVNRIDGVALSAYGVSNLGQWTTVSIPVGNLANKKVKVALAFLLGTTVGSGIEVKDIGFLSAAGQNVDICRTVTWTDYNIPALKASMNLVWKDEFSVPGAPDPSSWTYDVDADNPFGPDNRWGNAEAQIYTNTRANSYVDQAGALNIVAKYDAAKNEWTSARLKTLGLRDFKYGYIEIRAKVPTEGGSWPAIWMLPSQIKYRDPRPGTVTYGNAWPASGEIDIMEHATNFPYWGGAGSAHGTVHTFSNSGLDHGYAGQGMGGAYFADINTSWHTYAILWKADKIVLFYDDQKLGEYNDPKTAEAWMGWPFSEKFHLIFNLAMGGKLGGRIDVTSDVVMKVDHVRVWQ